jgi:hypothetical protein
MNDEINGARDVTTTNTYRVETLFEKATVTELSKLPATARPVVVRSSRVGDGRVIGRPEFDGIGTLSGDNLNPQKARILLMLALTKPTDPRKSGGCSISTDRA